jgi:hypothetical protein
MKSTVSISFDEVTRKPAPETWAGRSIMIRHCGSETVRATSRGLVAVGATESEALEKLASLVRIAERSEQDEGVKTVPLCRVGR